MQYVLTEAELRTFAQEVAGRSSVPFMTVHPSMVMPSEELVVGVDECLRDRFGIKPEERYGYDAPKMAATDSAGPCPPFNDGCNCA